MASVAQVAPRERAARSRGWAIGGWWRPVALIASVTIGYFFSLDDLVRAMKFETPLAYLGLVPPLAFALGCWCYRRAGAAPAPLTAMDVAAGGGLICLAVLTAVGLPITLDAYAWSKRLDLLSLPLFAAGVLILLYGNRALGWAWPALLYLFLVWPVPYDIVLGRFLAPLTEWTALAVGGLLHLIPLGTAVDPSDRTIFTVATPFGAQQASIGSVCAGFNSFVAWFLIGAAACVVLRGRRGIGGLGTLVRRVSWVLLGLALTLIVNVVRVFFLFVAVHKDGFGTLFAWVHALLGLTLFAGVVLLMLLLAGRFGLMLPADGPAPAPAPANTGGAFPVQAAFVALGAFLLALGALLGLGIMQMLIAFICVFAVCLLFTLDFPRAGAARSADAPAIAPARHDAPLRPLALVAWLLGGAAAIAAAYAFTRFLAGRTLAIHALGWQIGAWEQETVTGPERFALVAVVAVLTLLVLRQMLRAPRYQPGAERPLRLRPLVGPRAGALVGGLLLVSTTALALTNVTVASFGLGASASDVAAADFDAAPADIPGMAHSYVTSFDWAKQFLGSTSTYNRYRYDGDMPYPLWIDIVTTEDADALAYHQVHNCYAFHGYVNEGEREVNIGHGVSGHILNHYKPETDENWTTFYWEQQVVRGGKTFYQRIVLLYYLDAPDGTVAASARYTANNAQMQLWASQILDSLVAAA